jgi:cyclopropane-fatty-acyl-phospholipid synthase
MWRPLFSRMIESVVRSGTLTVHLPGGEVLHAGDGTGTPVILRITDEAMIKRLVTNTELALGEGYTDGTITIDDDDLHGFFRLAVTNARRNDPPAWLTPANGVRHLMRRLRQFNPARRARRNVAHHYDLSAELYDLFLDTDKQYSCAYFRHPDMSLEDAQVAKKAHIAAKLQIEPGMRVLDIGCGWGGMGLTLARDHGAQVIGVTLERGTAQDRHRQGSRGGAVGPGGVPADGLPQRVRNLRPHRVGRHVRTRGRAALPRRISATSTTGLPRMAWR